MKEVNYNARYSYKGNNSFLYAMLAIFTIILDYVPWCTKRTRHVGKSTESIWAPGPLTELARNAIKSL